MQKIDKINTSQQETHDVNHDHDYNNRSDDNNSDSCGTIAKTTTATDLAKMIVMAPASTPTTTIPDSHCTTTTMMTIMAVMAGGGSALWTMPLHCVYIYIIYM